MLVRITSTAVVMRIRAINETVEAINGMPQEKS
jgi:hypothetical protein